MCLSHGRQLETIHGGESQQLISYQLVIMKAPELDLCVAAAHAGGLTINGVWHGASGKEDLPKYIGHGTSIESAMAILVDGAIMPSPGIAGQGVYGFGLQDPDDDAEVSKLYMRGCAGGYTRGALFILKVHGVFVNTSSTCILPPGCIGQKKDQLAASAGSIQYHSVIFHLDGVVHSLGRFLDDSGYSCKLYDALCKAKKYLESKKGGCGQGPVESPIPAEDLVFLENELITKGVKQVKPQLDKRAQPSSSSSGSQVVLDPKEMKANLIQHHVSKLAELQLQLDKADPDDEFDIATTRAAMSFHRQAIASYELEVMMLA